MLTINPQAAAPDRRRYGRLKIPPHVSKSGINTLEAMRLSYQGTYRQQVRLVSILRLGLTGRQTS